MDTRSDSTQVRHCIEEWKTGQQIAIDITQDVLKPRYLAMSKALLDWESLDKKMCKRIRASMFDEMKYVIQLNLAPILTTLSREYTEIDSDDSNSKSDTDDLKAQKKQEMLDWFVGESADSVRMDDEDV